MPHTAIRIDRSFRLRLVSPIGGQEAEAQLTRLNAQLLGLALLEYAGVSSKSIDRGPVTIVIAETVVESSTKQSERRDTRQR